MEPAFTVGGDGDAFVLGSVRGINVDANGTVFVGDGDNSKVWVVGPDGALVREVGSSGEGPGEFMRLSSVVVSESDSVYVYDSGLRRVSVFSPDETAFVRSFTLAPNGGKPPVGLAAVRNGNAYVRYIQPYTQDNLEAERSETLALHGLDGRLVTPELMQTPATETLVDSQGGGFSVARKPFGRSSQVVVTDAGDVLSGWTDTVDIKSVSATGAQGLAYSYNAPPVPVTSEEVDALMDETTNERTLQMYRDADIADTKPAFSSLVSDDQGRLWVGLSASDGAPTPWVVFDAAGEAVAHASTPADVSLRVVSAERAYGVEQDDLGVQRLAVFEVSGL